MAAVICRPNPFWILGPMVTHTNHFCLHLRVGELSGVLPDSVMPDLARFNEKASSLPPRGRRVPACLFHLLGALSWDFFLDSMFKL